MRGNAMKDRMRKGDLVIGTMIFEFLSPGIAQMAENMGLDFVLYDMEHNGTNLDIMRWQMAAYRGLKVAPLVRVRAKEYQYVAQALDVGAMGVMVPMVNNAEEAREIVRWAKYPTEGVRGAAFGFAHDDYSGGDTHAKGLAENARTVVMALIETPDGLANIDEILAVPGLDMVQLGHMDLANFMGIPGQYDHPDIVAGMERIVAAARKHGKTAGRMVLTPEEGAKWIAKGWRSIVYSFDIHAFTSYIGEGVRAIRKG